MEDQVGLAVAQCSENHGLGGEASRWHNESLGRRTACPAGRKRNGGAPTDVGTTLLQKITIYTTAWCGYCRAAKQLLEDRGLGYEEIGVDDDPRFRERLRELTGGWTVPQILIGDEPVGGHMELARLARRGDLDELTAPAG